MTGRMRVVLSSACAALSVMLFAAYASHVREEAERIRLDAIERYGGEVVTLAVARVALEPGDVVTSSNVAMREWLSDLAPEGAVTSLDEVAGLEVGVPLSKGAPLTDVTFRSASEMAEVPAGCVAVTIPVTDKLGVSRNVPTGSTLAAYEVSASGTRLISSGMTVLSSPVGSGALSASQQITVAVASDDVPLVLTAAATSDLRLVLPAKGVAVGETEDGGAPVELTEEEAAEQAKTGEPSDATDDEGGDGSEGTGPSEDENGEAEKSTKGEGPGREGADDADDASTAGSAGQRDAEDDETLTTDDAGDER